MNATEPATARYGWQINADSEEMVELHRVLPRGVHVTIEVSDRGLYVIATRERLHARGALAEQREGRWVMSIGRVFAVWAHLAPFVRARRGDDGGELAEVLLEAWSIYLERRARRRPFTQGTTKP